MQRAALGVLVLLALSTASAQVPVGPGATSLIVALLDPGAGFPPGGQGNVEIFVTYQYPPGAAPQPNPSPEVAENTTATQITLLAKQLPSWVDSVEFVPPTLSAKIPIDKQAPGGRIPMSANVTLHIKADAPAITREDLIVAADAASNGNLQASHGESAPIKLRVAPVGKLNVSAELQLVIPGGRWTTIVYQVKNEGNSEVVAKLNVTVRPENSEVEFPRSITLASGATAPVEVKVRTPWTNAELGTLTLEAIPLVDGEEGRAASWDVELRGESAVPGVGLTGLAVACALALLLARRR